MAITLAQAEAKLTLWMTAEDKVASGQSYVIEIDGSRRELRRANLTEIREAIAYWNNMAIALGRRASSRSRVRYVKN